MVTCPPLLSNERPPIARQSRPVVPLLMSGQRLCLLKARQTVFTASPNDLLPLRVNSLSFLNPLCNIRNVLTVPLQAVRNGLLAAAVDILNRRQLQWLSALRLQAQLATMCSNLTVLDPAILPVDNMPESRRMARPSLLNRLVPDRSPIVQFPTRHLPKIPPV